MLPSARKAILWKKKKGKLNITTAKISDLLQVKFLLFYKPEDFKCLPTKSILHLCNK
jgi:hypothetical protein